MRFSESKEINEIIFKAIHDAEENQDPLYNIQDASVFKRVLVNDGMLTEYICGRDVGLKFVLKAISDYCNYKEDENYSYDYDIKLVKNLFDEFNRYAEYSEEETKNVDQATALQYAKDEIESNTFNTDLTGMKLIALKDLANNSRAYVLKLRCCFEYFMTGTMDAPSEDKLKDVYYGPGSKTKSISDEILKMPVCLHLPTRGDITDSMIEELSCFAYMRKICDRNFRRILNMFCDNDDGTVWVRIYRKEDGEYKPVYVKLHKAHVYMRWVLHKRHENLWTGLIRDAFDMTGIACSEISGEEFVSLCFGEELDPEDAVEEIKDEAYYLSHFNENSSIEYTRMGYELYLSMIATASFKISVEPEFKDLAILIKRLLVFTPTVVGLPKSAISKVMDLLQAAAATYKKAYGASGEKRNILRVQTCDSIETFYHIYNTNDANSMRPYSIMKKKKG